MTERMWIPVVIAVAIVVLAVWRRDSRWIRITSALAFLALHLFTFGPVASALVTAQVSSPPGLGADIADIAYQRGWHAGSKTSVEALSTFTLVCVGGLFALAIIPSLRRKNSEQSDSEANSEPSPVPGPASEASDP